MSATLPARGWHLKIRGRDAVLGVPYLWLLVFFAVPFLILLRISITDVGEHLDPFAPLIGVRDGSWQLLWKPENFFSLVRDPQGPWAPTLYIESYLLSIKYAACTTALCLLIGYPFAYFVARTRPVLRSLLLLMIMLPFWTSFLLRVYAWKGILADQGVVNQVLLAIGVIQQPIQMLYTDVSMLVGMTYVYLPFMVLPLYANLVKMDLRLIEASQDLGASAWKTFWLITVPLSRAGILAGSLLVFVPSMGEFVIPSLLGGAENLMIGRVVWDEMFSSNNWPRASALAITMIVLVVLPLAIYNQRVARKVEGEAL